MKPICRSCQTRRASYGAFCAHCLLDMQDRAGTLAGGGLALALSCAGGIAVACLLNSLPW